ncbi:MAG: thiamine diphosphokinase [Tissierellia bacterium]|nr:thiamine diphosphokinase [Tissierellia bacterium]
MTAVILTGGDMLSPNLIKREINNSKYIICADSGYDSIANLNIKPDILLGDFDSIKNKEQLNSNLNVLKYPTKKDFIDTELAIEHAIEKGFKNIKILGGYGSRADHSLINILMLKRYSDAGIKIYLVNNNNKITYCDKNLEIKEEDYDYISIIPYSENVKVSTYNLEYELKEGIIPFGTSLGISNKIKSHPAKIDLVDGQAFIIFSKD